MISPFVYSPAFSRVRFGSGSHLDVSTEVERLGRKVLVITTVGQAELGVRLASTLGSIPTHLLPTAVMHTPVEVTVEAVKVAHKAEVDVILAIGGGSAIGLGKGVAKETGLPIIAMPTTFSGSEATPVWGESAHGNKTTGRDARVLPRTIIYDPLLVLPLPAAIAAASGMNAIAHAVEGLYSADANPVTSLKAVEGIRALAGALPYIIDDDADAGPRGDALYGAWLCGTVLAEVSMGLHHKLCHTLGGVLGLPHAQTHAILLPHSLAYNAAAAPEANQRVARALNAPDGVQGLFELLQRLPIAKSLREIGMRQEEISKIARQAVEKPYPNPEPLREDGIAALLENAWAGRTPRAVGV
ncbi:maleylacetate reductase [Sphingobium sp. EP60837]|uniref:maleylacetate reductase n=1 Tax=Sphingobium sp. EP60837 TaxID=1855519 RepID=UPI0007DD593B|nr:maleylacetate reductase [Sphingobium sp. EP60837]ANI80213.1 Maleylacetate reductase [Sphingobium sp. EP60837]